MRRRAFVLIFFWVFAVTSLVRAQDAEVNWRHDYNAARAEAKAKGLPLVLDFGTKNCFFCQKMDSSTFRDPRIVKLLNESFVPLKIDAQEEAVLEVVSKLGITAYPTFVFAGPDWTILDKFEGFKEADVFHESLQRVLAALTAPDWMTRDLASASKAVAAEQYPAAIAALRRIIEDGGSRPIQNKARAKLAELEQRARERLAKAQQAQEKGKVSEAMRILNLAMTDFPGLNASREAADLLAKLEQTPQVQQEQRAKRARELLAQATECHRTREYTLCVDRCAQLMRNFGDLPEGQQGAQLFAEIKNDPEWLQNACDTFGDQLAEMYLAMAESQLKRGQPQQAKTFLERTIRAFPGTHQAESAQIRLEQLQGTRRVDFQSPP
jgi:thioredoxin-related protein